MRLKFSAIGLLVIWLAGAAIAEQQLFFADLWNSAAYYGTNIERKSFNSILARFEGKLGINVVDLPLQAYGVYYGVAAQSNDYWDNAIYYGAGLRFRPLAGYAGSNWTDEWLRDLKVYYEPLTATYLKNASSGEANPRQDTRYGLDLWHEWNLDNYNPALPWGEIWSNLSFRSTNFAQADFNSYIFYFQPKLGWHLGRGIETYLKTDITSSPRNDYWLNVADYGVGLRFEPWRQMYLNTDNLLKKFKMFIEVLGVSYLKDQPADSTKNVTNDVRFGIDFSLGR
ncbi:hypothetical protein A2311_01945 [candidate division WOR-1 bacterium RIFOXYB2_FULL_48_7]|uniref:Uncharacterized protein n=1 Tax=candidate division WOR-1 bacterium RIFOXYB2_FULL_48_7 TaxID=1802583 RepID=A0A1F4TLW5_UNCSA|nr:MAG: hypothetical protein A2311_01945 [candidate division WOR-1 bacterium RIFOXYB2_FULL_48_7]